MVLEQRHVVAAKGVLIAAVDMRARASGIEYVVAELRLIQECRTYLRLSSFKECVKNDKCKSPEQSR